MADCRSEVSVREFIKIPFPFKSRYIWLPVATEKVSIHQLEIEIKSANTIDPNEVTDRVPVTSFAESAMRHSTF
jgi:hypothetical protein